MSATVFKINQENIDMQVIDYCVKALNSGKTVVFPTETVYGIGVDAFNESAVKALYEKKQRSYDKPLLMHIHGVEMAESVAVLNDSARELMRLYTPGPLTIVAKKQNSVPSIVVSGGETVGLRFPSNKLFIELSKAFGKPIAATSANISGFESAKDSSGLQSVLDIADIVIDCGVCDYGLESTILSLVENQPKILRQGAFPSSKIEEVIGKCE